MIRARFHPNRAARLGVVALVLMTLCIAAEGAGLGEAFGLMEHERTLGEANAGLLKTFAKDDTATLARGIQSLKWRSFGEVPALG